MPAEHRGGAEAKPDSLFAEAKDVDWDDLTQCEMRRSIDYAGSITPALHKLLGGSKAAQHCVLQFLVSPYILELSSKSALATYEVFASPGEDSETAVRVQLTHVNQTFTKWKLTWSNAGPGFAAPNQDLWRMVGFRSRRLFGEQCSKPYAFGLVYHRDNDLVQHLLTMLVVFPCPEGLDLEMEPISKFPECETKGSIKGLLENEPLKAEARRSFESFASDGEYTYKYVVTLLSCIGERLHAKDPRFPHHEAFAQLQVTPDLAHMNLPSDADPWKLAHSWVHEDPIEEVGRPLIDVSIDMECIRICGDSKLVTSVATRFVVWRYLKETSSIFSAAASASPTACLCYVFLCPEDMDAEPSLKADGWRSQEAIQSAGWLVHPLGHCEWSWPEEDETPPGVECRSMCCRDAPIVRKIITDIAAPTEELRSRIGNLHPTEYRSFLLKALDYLAD